MTCGSENEALNEIHRRWLNILREVTAHSELATAAALHYCAEHHVCPPGWLVDRAAALMCDLLKREKSRNRGRTAGAIARYRQDFWHMERWDAVKAVHRARNKIARNRKILRSIEKRKESGYQSIVSWVENMEAWLRNGTEECAARTLRGRDARAGTHTMMASYKLVQRSLKNPATASRFHVFDESFLVRLGFPGFFETKPGKKWVLFTDLTE